VAINKAGTMHSRDRFACCIAPKTFCRTESLLARLRERRIGREHSAASMRGFPVGIDARLTHIANIVGSTKKKEIFLARDESRYRSDEELKSQKVIRVRD
jgi:hypothetical protein